MTLLNDYVVGHFHICYLLSVILLVSYILTLKGDYELR